MMDALCYRKYDNQHAFTRDTNIQAVCVEPNPLIHQLTKYDLIFREMIRSIKQFHQIWKNIHSKDAQSDSQEKNFKLQVKPSEKIQNILCQKTLKLVQLNTEIHGQLKQSIKNTKILVKRLQNEKCLLEEIRALKNQLRKRILISQTRREQLQQTNSQIQQQLSKLNFQIIQKQIINSDQSVKNIQIKEMQLQHADQINHLKIMLENQKLKLKQYSQIKKSLKAQLNKKQQQIKKFQKVVKQYQEEFLNIQTKYKSYYQKLFESKIKQKQSDSRRIKRIYSLERQIEEGKQIVLSYQKYALKQSQYARQKERELTLEKEKNQQLSSQIQKNEKRTKILIQNLNAVTNKLIILGKKFNLLSENEIKVVQMNLIQIKKKCDVKRNKQMGKIKSYKSLMKSSYINSQYQNQLEQSIRSINNEQEALDNGENNNLDKLLNQIVDSFDEAQQQNENKSVKYIVNQCRRPIPQHIDYSYKLNNNVNKSQSIKSNSIGCKISINFNTIIQEVPLIPQSQNHYILKSKSQRCLKNTSTNSNLDYFI